jgi:uncharacterized membrane protein
MTPLLTKKRDPKVGVFKHWWQQLVRYMGTGMLVWIPLIVTLWVTWFLFVRLVGSLNNGMKALVANAHEIAARVPQLEFLDRLQYVPGAGFILALLMFMLTGFLARFLVGRRIIAYGEQILNRIPLISRVYRAVQQIRDVFITREGAVFQKVCLVEYPRKGMYVVGFVTSGDRGIVQETLEKHLTAVFIPTTPNPTSGFLVYLPPEEITELNINIEEGMKLIISGGAYLPGKSEAHGTLD